MNFSQISERVGNGAIACASLGSGTSATIAIVAACRKSATSGPTIVAPIRTSG